jgi:hypothetical protein
MIYDARYTIHDMKEADPGNRLPFIFLDIFCMYAINFL